MTTENPSSSARYQTLSDYLRVLRRYWMMVVAVMIVGGAAGFVYAKGQTASYKATAEVGFQDPSQQVGIVGLPLGTPQTPAQLAVVAADLVTAPSVMDEVRRELHMTSSASTLAGALIPGVAPSGLLALTATARDPRFAANLANTTARVLVAQDNAQVRTQFARVAAIVQQRISALTARHGTSNPSELGFYEDEIGRLQTLSSFATTAQFDKPAVVAVSRPTTKTRGALLGLLFGLLLGILAAFVRDATDRRLRGGKDVQTSFGLPVLGHVRNRALGGVVQIADRPRRGSARDVAAFRIVRRNLELLEPGLPPKTILVTSAVAEEGKTTVAASLAAAIASAGRRTLLIEADLRRPVLASRLGVEPAPGLTDYVTEQATPQEVLRTIDFAEGSGKNGSTNGHIAETGLHRLVLIPSGSRSSTPAELLGSTRFKELLQQVSDNYDAVVLDAAPLLPVSDTLEIASSVDAVVLCVRESQTTREQAAAAKTALARIPCHRVGVVVTGIRPRRAGEEVAYAHAYNYA